MAEAGAGGHAIPRRLPRSQPLLLRQAFRRAASSSPCGLSGSRRSCSPTSVVLVRDKPSELRFDPLPVAPAAVDPLASHIGRHRHAELPLGRYVILEGLLRQGDGTGDDVEVDGAAAREDYPSCLERLAKLLSAAELLRRRMPRI